ncbi:hypothetical protein CGMCC3_g17649 [Colletotrichum fructicola]|nr:uncharacterized protein CGMCC3_g17649 [Colletotrichum fructicola]KAE9566191.1 hypothetical protein CGMCC3_g17649 [Colletotrichum fructicola]
MLAYQQQRWPLRQRDYASLHAYRRLTNNIPWSQGFYSQGGSRPGSKEQLASYLSAQGQHSYSRNTPPGLTTL